MAFLFSDDFETELTESLDEALGGNSRNRTHAVTAILCTPTNSVGRGSSTSKQSSIASLILFMSKSRALA